MVNDPAAPHAGAVARSYDLDEFQRVWLGAKGIGYVLAPAETMADYHSEG
jgi:hypothetical protein